MTYETRTFPAAGDLVDHILDPVRSDDEPDEVGGHHHQDVEDPARRADVAVPWLVPILFSVARQPSCTGIRIPRWRGGTHLRRWQEKARRDLRHYEQTDEPAPR